MKRGAIVAEPKGLVFRTDREHAHAPQVAAGARRRKWNATEAIDQTIRRAYQKFIEQNDRHALKRAATEIRWPKHAVGKRAAELGFSRVKEADWSLAEVAILEANTMYGYEMIRKKLREAGFERSRTSVLQKRRRMGLVRAYDGYSATSLSKLMGIDGHGVTAFIERGWLAAEHRGTGRTAAQGGDSYYISHAAVRAFLFGHADAWDLRKVERWWFLDLITDGAITK